MICLKSLSFDHPEVFLSLFGAHDGVLKNLEAITGVEIYARGSDIQLKGSSREVEWTEEFLKTCHQRLLQNEEIPDQEEMRVMFRLFQHASVRKGEGHLCTLTFPNKKQVVAKTAHQDYYLRKILSRDVVFGLGPAGTGKTYLAVAAGVSLLGRGAVERLILSRPAISAGENLGFLPGDSKEKMDPYMRPLYDALADLLPAEVLQQRLQSGHIEIAPLAYMRGRTLSRAFIILDEAQNTTCGQMKMFLTRLGPFSQMVITGDLSQIDLPPRVPSGLQEACEVLADLPSLSFCIFDETDVCRHPIVGQILRAYHRFKDRACHDS